MPTYVVNILNNLAHVVSSGTSNSFEFDFITGDFSPNITSPSTAFTIGPSLGTTTNGALVGPVNQITATDISTFEKNEWCMLVLTGGSSFLLV